MLVSKLLGQCAYFRFNYSSSDVQLLESCFCRPLLWTHRKVIFCRNVKPYYLLRVLSSLRGFKQLEIDKYLRSSRRVFEESQIGHLH